jgi:hypothetical protein
MWRGGHPEIGSDSVITPVGDRFLMMISSPHITLLWLIENFSTLLQDHPPLHLLVNTYFLGGVVLHIIPIGLNYLNLEVIAGIGAIAR